MVRAIYIGIDPRLTGAAGYSVLAHLEDLVARGIVATDGDPLIDGTYRLAAAEKGAIPSSFPDVQLHIVDAPLGAGPESILPIVVMDSGVARNRSRPGMTALILIGA